MVTRGPPTTSIPSTARCPRLIVIAQPLGAPSQAMVEAGVAVEVVSLSRCAPGSVDSCRQVGQRLETCWLSPRPDVARRAPARLLFRRRQRCRGCHEQHSLFRGWWPGCAHLGSISESSMALPGPRSSGLPRTPASRRASPPSSPRTSCAPQTRSSLPAQFVGSCRSRPWTSSHRRRPARPDHASTSGSLSTPGE